MTTAILLGVGRSHPRIGGRLIQIKGVSEYTFNHVDIGLENTASIIVPPQPSTPDVDDHDGESECDVVEQEDTYVPLISGPLASETTTSKMSLP